MASDRYSRLVSWLKVLFPLAALGLLSTLFLLSRVIDPEAVIPFADKEIQDRLRDQQVTGPFFSGTTADGDQISFSAETLTTPQGQTSANRAEDVRAVINLTSGTEVVFVAAQASFDLAQDRADLTGDVLITTSTGFRVVTDALTSTLSALNIHSPGQVEGTGPPGVITAGEMRLSLPDNGDPAQLLFTNGVKLIYNPKQVEE